MLGLHLSPAGGREFDGAGGAHECVATIADVFQNCGDPCSDA